MSSADLLLPLLSPDDLAVATLGFGFGRDNSGPKLPPRYISMSATVSGVRVEEGALAEANHSAERMLASLKALLARLIRSRAVLLRGFGVMMAIAGSLFSPRSEP